MVFILQLCQINSEIFITNTLDQHQPVPAVNVFLFADIRISTYRSIIATFKFHSLSFHLFRWLLWSWFSIHVEFKFNTGHSRWGEVHQGRKLYWIRMIFVVKINLKKSFVMLPKFSQGDRQCSENVFAPFLISFCIWA